MAGSADALTRAGYQVDAVENGEVAWETLQAASYDLLITDNRMPGLSGIEFVRKLRSAQMKLPVIFASGGAGPKELAQSQWPQPAAALPKPFAPGQLLETVAHALAEAAPVAYRSEISFSPFAEAHGRWGINE